MQWHCLHFTQRKIMQSCSLSKSCFWPSIQSKHRPWRRVKSWKNNSPKIWSGTTITGSWTENCTAPTLETGVGSRFSPRPFIFKSPVTQINVVFLFACHNLTSTYLDSLTVNTLSVASTLVTLTGMKREPVEATDTSGSDSILSRMFFIKLFFWFVLHFKWVREINSPQHVYDLSLRDKVNFFDGWIGKWPLNVHLFASSRRVTLLHKNSPNTS